MDRVAKPTQQAIKQRTQICPRVTGIWSSPQTAVQCLTFCFAVPLKRGPNVALSSPQSTAIECFLARLDRPTSLPPRLGRLGRHPGITKATAPRQANRDLGSNPCSVACNAFPVCCLAVTNITVFPTARSRFPIYLPGVRTVR